MTTITIEHRAALKNARQYAQACIDALRDCTQPGTPAVLSYSVRELIVSASKLAASIDSVSEATEFDAAPGSQQ